MARKFENANLDVKEEKRIISKPLIIENKEVFFAKTDFIFEGEGRIIFINSRCVINDCTFTGKTEIIFGGYSEGIIENCKFVNNESENPMIVVLSNSKLKLKSCEFSGNKLSGKYGRCVEMRDNTENVIESCKFVNNDSEKQLVFSFGSSKLKLISCEFSGNKLSGEYGRCVDMKDNTENVIENCKFVNNESENALIGTFRNSKLKLISCEFSGNKFSSKYGRCIDIVNNTENVIESCKFVNNESESPLIVVFNYSKLKLISCEFSGNKLFGEYGSCVLMEDNTENEIESCKFVNNETENIMVFSRGSSKLKLISCEFSDNKLFGEYGSCISMTNTTENEIENCKFINNKSESNLVNVFENSKVKINNSYYIDTLYSETPNIEICNSKIGIIKYKNYKPKIYNTEVEKWEKWERYII
jgi:nitrous oxidase accessory protein NosD